MKLLRERERERERGRERERNGYRNDHSSIYIERGKWIE